MKTRIQGKPEILSPAGDIDCIKAAFAAGADAVYFGLPAFNARQRAKNIEPDMLRGISSEAALRGIKLYLTVNTLVTEDEIPLLLELLDTAAMGGITAFIIQDMGVFYILKKLYPGAEIHISTQATTHTGGQVEFLARAGAARVNLARELSLEEVREFTSLAHMRGMETEVFVHGSYCLSYSGQCYLCSFLEGTSGNRGLCQQNCRRQYRKNGKTAYFLNLKDNCASDFAFQLVEAGVDSLKIEGRIKSPAYVYSAVKGWKLLVSGSGREDTSKAGALLDGVFNRDFTAGYLAGEVGRHMFAESPQDRSIRKFSSVINYTADSRILAVDSPVPASLPAELVIRDRTGSYICTLTAREELRQQEAGEALRSGKHGGRKGPVYSYRTEITGKLAGKISPGDLVYSSRPALERGEVEKAVAGVVFRDPPLRAVISAEPGKNLVIKFSAAGREAVCSSSSPAAVSVTAPLSRENITKLLSRLGGTGYVLSETSFEKWDDNIFLPASEINSMRRKCIAALVGKEVSNAQNGEGKRLYETDERLSVLYGSGSPAGNIRDKSRLCVYLDNTEAAMWLKSDYGNSIDIMLETGDPEEALQAKDFFSDSFMPVLPAVMEFGAEKQYSLFLDSIPACTVVLNNTALVRNAVESGKKWVAGNFLNITNSMSLRFFTETGGMTGAIASLELSSAQLEPLLMKAPVPVSLFIYSAVKLMTTRQCLLGYRCGKKTGGSDCYYSCAGEESLDEIGGRKLRICKRKWNYTELYDSSFISVPELVPVFKDRAERFIIDLRDLGSPGHNSEKLDETVRIFLEYIEKPDAANRKKINSVCRNITKGNLRKGL